MRRIPSVPDLAGLVEDEWKRRLEEQEIRIVRRRIFIEEQIRERDKMIRNEAKRVEPIEKEAREARIAKMEAARKESSPPASTVKPRVKIRPPREIVSLLPDASEASLFEYFESSGGKNGSGGFKGGRGGRG